MLTFPIIVLTWIKFSLLATKASAIVHAATLQNDYEQQDSASLTTLIQQKQNKWQQQQRERQVQETCVVNKTLSDLLGPFYLSNSPQTRIIGPIDEINDPSKRLEVVGRIVSTTTCRSTANETILYRPLSNVTMEIWYAGTPDANGNFYQKNKYRGQITTNQCGLYRYVQSFPVIYPLRPIIHTHFRLSRGNNEILVSQMYYVGDAKGYYNDGTISSVLGRRRDLQALIVSKRPDGTRVVRFNIFLSKFDGNRKCKPIAISSQYNITPRVES